MKKILLLFVVMLGTLCAYAQSNTPIKGDVNEDGVVDVADIVAIIDIMMNGGGTSANYGYYYWYIGTTDPTTMTDITPIVSDNSSPGWRLIGNALPSNEMLWNGVENNISFGERSEYYLALPSSTLKVYNGAGYCEMDGYTSLGTKVINGVTYYIYKDNVKVKAFAFDIYSTSSDYYWYVGTTMPSNPLSAEENTGLNEWTHLGTTLPISDIEVAKVDETYTTNATWYIAAPTVANFTLYNATNAASDEVGWDKTTIDINNVSYTLWTSRVQSFQAAEYLHYENKYYWYIGPTDPTTMSDNSPLVSDTSSSGWRFIGGSLPTYSFYNRLWDGSENSISFGERTEYYLALPSSALRIYAGGDDMDSYTSLGTKIINGVTYYIYKANYKAKAFGSIIY